MPVITKLFTSLRDKVHLTTVYSKCSLPRAHAQGVRMTGLVRVGKGRRHSMSITQMQGMRGVCALRALANLFWLHIS